MEEEKLVQSFITIHSPMLLDFKPSPLDGHIGKAINQTSGIVALELKEKVENSTKNIDFKDWDKRITNEEQIYLLRDEISDRTTIISYGKIESQLIVIKTYCDRNREMIERYQNEAKILEHLSSLNYPFFLKFYHQSYKTLLNSDNFEFYIIMEYCPSTLHRQIMEQFTNGCKSNKTLAKIVHKLICGFAELGKHKIVHRDIKPQNIFVTYDGDYKIGDFGISTSVASISEEYEYLIQGTRDYMAPELISELNKSSKKSVKFKYNLEKADVYSLGLVLFKVYTGRRAKGINKINSSEKLCEILDQIKIAWLRRTLDNMLILDPAKRFTFKEVYEFLNQDNEFIKDLSLA